MKTLCCLVVLCCSCSGDGFSSAVGQEGGAGASFAGAAGSSGGGSEAQAGAAGQGAAGAAAGASGAPADGSAGAAGTSSGGAGGSSSVGGAGGSAGSSGTGGEPSCTPDQAVNAELFPTTFAWPSWSWTYGGKCISCATAPCAPAQPLMMVPPIASPPRWNNGELEVLFESAATEYVNVHSGTCGNESNCAFMPVMSAATAVTVAPSGNGWRITKVLSVGHVTMAQSTCDTLLPDYTAASLADSYRAALDAVLTGIVMPCP